MSRNLSPLLGMNLSRAARLMRTKLDERLAPLGLTQAKWLILIHLSRNGGLMPQKDIAERIGVEGPTVVRVLDGLERLGFVERRDQPGDRRSKDVVLTSRAATTLGAIERVTDAFRQEIWAGVSDDDLAACDRVITVLLRNLSALAPDAD